MARHARPPALESFAGPAATDAEHAAEPYRCCDGRETCRSCAQRRKHAWRLVAGGLNYEQAAERMRLTPGRVRLLVAQERDKQDLERYKLDMVEAEQVRAFLEHELERNPDLTRGKVARYLNVKQIDLERQLGYEPRRDGSRQRRVGIEAASKLVIALGRAPHELDGC